MKKLYRSDDNKVLAGIVGGIGEYLDIDPVILRVIVIIIMVFTAFVPVALIYLLALFVIPKKSDEPRIIDVEEEDVKE